MAVTLTPQAAVKRLVAVGNNELWYEDSTVPGTMIKLDASDGNIDTSDKLTMFEAYSKVFIVNGANLKVADFINTKLTSNSEITTYLPVHGDLLVQDQTGGDLAYMVVDFISAWAGGTHLIYGYAYYAGDATAFTTAHDVKNANGDTVIGSANLTTVTASPHFYAWTVYNGDEDTYGTMPNKAYLGCLYRGRGVISGDPEHPHQWSMTRQGNLWDFNYAKNDAQTAVAGSNADMGELGDIVATLIPYKDDYLVFGCASQIWFAAGDPAAGGSLNELDLTTGMYSGTSWCIDNAGNLYFWGTNGVYKTTIPGVPENISRLHLPRLVASEDVNPATHRITLAYDRRRTGIIICITKLLDGTNSNYFYDLVTNGFFPETYPTECGVYSAFYYAANDVDFSGLLLGSKDGYVRIFDDDSKSDILGDDSTNAINAYCTWGPLKLAQDEDYFGLISALEVITAGGASDGSQADSDNVSYNIFVADTAEEILEKLYANTDYRIAGTITAPGRPKGAKIRKRIRGMYLGIRLWNSTVAETWAINKIIGTIKKGGRFR